MLVEVEEAVVVGDGWLLPAALPFPGLDGFDMEFLCSAFFACCRSLLLINDS